MLVDICAYNPRIDVVAQAEDGLQALLAIRELKPEVVLLDIRMPKFSGLDVLRVMKEESLECTAVVITSFSDQTYRHKCFELGAKHVFDKTKEIAEVLKFLRSL